jgi:DNA-binding MarR family transcriptional regulator
MSTRDDLGFLLAKASQRWNELLAERFRSAGYREVRPAYGSVLVPLFEQDGLRMGELARRSRLSKQTMTTLVRRVEAAGLVRRVADPDDARAMRIELTDRAHRFAPIAAEIVAELERRFRRRLGNEALAQLRAALRQIAEI